MMDLFSCLLMESPSQYYAPCRVRGRRRGRRGYYYATSLLASYIQIQCYICTCYYIVIYNSATYWLTSCIRISLHLLLLLLLLLILYIDFLQLHSRHRQTYIFCHCFKQSEYSTADECIESHPTYMAG